jgi:hypothetical protein
MLWRMSGWTWRQQEVYETSAFNTYLMTLISEKVSPTTKYVSIYGLEVIYSA